MDTLVNYDSDKVLKSCQAKKIFDNDLKSDSVSHSYLLKCEDDLTRRIFANYFSKSLICANHKDNCVVCENIEKGLHPDIMILPEDSEQSLKVEDSIKILDNVNFFGMEQEKKIYILNYFEFATLQMQNKLLKVLEEPPQNVYFLLLCGQDSGVINPIKSRCKKLYINKLEDDSIDEILQKINALNTKKEMAIFIGNNYLGQTIKALNDNAMQSMFELCVDIFNNLDSSKHAIRYSSKIANYKTSFLEFLKIYSHIVAELYYYKSTNKFKTTLFNDDFKKFADKFSLAGLIKLQEKIISYSELYQRNCATNLIADTIIMDYLQAKIMN